ncbi:Charged multivesicular body protein 1b-2 [Dimargaris cristalligena]|uniref:Snf7 family n=1 Tax=Dimargaris cristalligena TaxID=215637 RepID=A0A4P9ZR99_9FUNG|nr:Charged multivesicular body protein 1b-2 [Dimargaris cristalligena]RKP35271.1 Snf7 family [Dimargaris cristalligena]|eukprot:RKP35271.1 Snf7 family [Dimargaris cristalligena]
MDKSLFQLKFTAKSLQRQAKQCTRDEAREKTKVKQAIKMGNTEGARIHAENAIRKKNEALNLLRLSSRIDGVASRVQTAVTMRQVTGSMTAVVGSMEKALNAMNLEKISLTMDKFETQFENLDLQAQYMEGTMSGTTTLTTPQADVDQLMQQVAEEHGLELNHQLGVPTNALPESPIADPVPKDDLTERLARLRNM